MSCGTRRSGAIDLYFYGELQPAERRRVQAHLAICPECLQALDDLSGIRAALASRPDVSAPPGGDWSGFMNRLDVAVREAGSGAGAGPGGRPWRLRATQAMYWAAAAAVVVLVAMNVLTRSRSVPDAAGPRSAPAPVTAAPSMPALPPDAALASLSDQHFERSKLVLLGLATRDPRRDQGDWTYERELASTLLDDTRLYRMAAEERGMTSLAGVMRDLELVLLETSMSEATDTASLEQLQRLIRRRDILAKMNAAYGGT